MRTSPHIIDKIAPWECFVFGSNLAGIHGAGAAKLALGWGAKHGYGIGQCGNTFAIPTKDASIVTMPLDAIRPYVSRFYLWAQSSPEWTYLVTEIGCGLAGYQPKDIAPLFGKRFLELGNVHLPERFIQHL